MELLGLVVKGLVVLAMREEEQALMGGEVGRGG